TISNLKNAFGDNVTVYNIVVPTHCEIGLPERFSDLYYSQREYLNNIFNNYSADIISVDPYYALMHHRNDYLYFSTDHHWTVDAAYLAYQVFAQKAGITALTEDDMERKSIEGFTGSLASGTGLTNTDTVYYYTFPNCDITTVQYDAYAENPVTSMLFHEYASGVNAYGVFLGGDMPLIVTTNEQGNGKKIAVVKESYGNAFAPFISGTYSETHIIDSRYFKANLKTYLEEHDIDTVIFINNTMASATGVRCEELNALVE
ncbi:MAG: DHHW family protein, partial [Acutalibacteraceae bacterium]